MLNLFIYINECILKNNNRDYCKNKRAKVILLIFLTSNFVLKLKS